MIKLLDILEEGTLTLTPEERQQVEDIIPNIIDNIKKPLLSNDKLYNVGTIKYKFADGEDGEALVAVGYPGSDKARGIFYTQDPKNRTDNWIVISHTYFQQYFPPNDFNQKLYQTFSGTANTGIERLRQVLKHELIHAKDPALNHQYLKEPYTHDEPVYYKSWTEFQTFTGQFFESLISGTDRVLDNVSDSNDIKRIESALANILQFFAGKTKTISIKTAEFIDGTGSRNIFQKLFNFIDSIVGNLPQSSDFALHEYVFFLQKIKQYNPEGYKEFLKDLYKTIKSIEEKVNSVSTTKIKVQEMKLSLNEVKRMQQLAGITNTEGYKNKLKEVMLEGEDENLVTDPRILALAAKIVKQPVDKIEDKVDAVLTGKEEENKEEINESFALTLTLALPMILEAGGSLAGWINKKYGLNKEELEEYKRLKAEYTKLDKTIKSYSDVKLTDPKTKRYVDNKKAQLAKMKEEENRKFGGKLSKFLKEAGHGLHSFYTSPIRALLWTISLFTPKGSDLRNKVVREKIANIIYAAGMVAFAGFGIYESVKHLVGVSEAATAILDGTKGGKSVTEIVNDIPVVAKAFAT